MLDVYYYPIAYIVTWLYAFGFDLRGSPLATQLIARRGVQPTHNPTQNLLYR